jgi:hypothetical protein
MREFTTKLAYRKSETATIANVCIRTLERMIHLGQFPPPTCRGGRSGKLPMWSIESIQAWSRGEWRPSKPKKDRAGAGAKQEAR